MKKLIFVFIVIILCSCQKLKYGNVVEMWHEPENDYMTLMPICISTGKTMTTVLVPFMIHDDEDWVIKIKGIGTKGDTITRKFYISKSEYDTLRIGKFICVNGMCDEDKGNTKTRKSN